MPPKTPMMPAADDLVRSLSTTAHRAVTTTSRARGNGAWPHFSAGFCERDGGAIPGKADMQAEERPGQLEATVGHLERLCGRLEQAEQQFKRLTDECDKVLHGLVAVDRRHSAAIASLNERLGDWCNLEGKLLEESSRRLERFERAVSHEWMVLRRLNEEPIADLREQAETLRQTCLEAARLARLRLESAEQAHAAQAEDIDRRLAEWTRQLLQAAQRQGADGQPPAPARLPDGTAPWSFEGVAQLHQEMRGGARRSEDDGPATRRDDPTGRREDDGEAETDVEAAAGQDRAGRWRPSRWLVAVRSVGLAALLALLVWTSGGPDAGGAAARGNGAAAVRPPATRPVPAAAPPAAAPAAAPEPDPRLIEAQRAAERAAILVEILAAPDLRRYALGGLGATPAAYAQVLWSRTRGLAITASRLPAPPASTLYQVWIRGVTGTASAGTLVPDANGRASLVVSGPLTLPAPGAIRVTIEPQGGSPQPTGEPCLAGGPTT